MSKVNNRESWLVGVLVAAMIAVVSMLMWLTNDEELHRLWNRSFTIIKYQQGQKTVTLEKDSGIFVDKFWVEYELPNRESMRRSANASVRMIFADIESPINQGEYILTQNQIENYFKDEVCFQLFEEIDFRPQSFCKGREVQSSTYSRLTDEPNRGYLVPTTMFQFYTRQPVDLMERRVFILPTATVVDRIVIEESDQSRIEFLRKVESDSEGKIESIRWFSKNSNGEEQLVVSTQVDDLLSILFSLQKERFLSKSEEKELPSPELRYQISLNSIIESPFEKNPFGSQKIGKNRIDVKIIKTNKDYFVESTDGLDQLSADQVHSLDFKLLQLWKLIRYNQLQNETQF